MSAELPALVSAAKILSVLPTWFERGVDVLEISVPLEAEGVVIEGLTLRGRVRKRLPDRGVMYQLEFHGANMVGGPVTRIEWRPLAAHSNRGIGPKELRHMLQTGSHLHPFDLNWKLSKERVLQGDLPIAVPLEPDPPNFRALLAVMGKEFNIGQIQEVGIPPWEPALL